MYENRLGKGNLLFYICASPAFACIFYAVKKLEMNPIEKNRDIEENKKERETENYGSDLREWHCLIRKGA